MNHRTTHRRLGLAALIVLVLAQMSSTKPMLGTTRAATGPQAATQLPPPPPSVKPNRTVPKVAPLPEYPLFPESPTAEDLFRARVFGEPLVPVGGEPSTDENQALAAAVTKFLRGGNAENPEALEAFLTAHPRSSWSPSILTNIGILYERTGRYTRAQTALREAWESAKDQDDRYAHAVADRALGELLEHHMKFGHVADLEELLDQAKDRSIVGAPKEMIYLAQQTVWGLKNEHQRAIPSGPTALEHVLLSMGRKRDPRLKKVHATPEGASIVEIGQLAREVGLDLEVAKSEAGAKIPVPSVVHLKMVHFAAVVRASGERYLLDDPLLGGEVWVTASALQEESSGYYLVPKGTLKTGGWKAVAASEVKTIRGKCAWPVGVVRGNTQSGSNGSGGNGGGGGAGGGCPMAVYRFYTMLANLHIEDTPVGYTPSQGPSVQFRVSYNHREATQPSIFYFSNVGVRWTHDWLSYIEDNPSNPAASVNVNLRGGGQETHGGFDGSAYALSDKSHAVIVRTSSSPVRFERRLPDGAMEVFGFSDGAATFPRRTFLTESIDPQGNKITFTYDGQLRLVAVTDALGQVTTLSYDYAPDAYKITKVTDPFGRFATLEYNASGALVRITDIIGITSEFGYGDFSSADFIGTLTTPYGTTSFLHGQGPNAYGGDMWVQATDPLGGTERLQYLSRAAGIYPGEPLVPATETIVPTGFVDQNSGLDGIFTAFWDKRAWSLYPRDLTKARITNWLYDASGSKITDFKHSEKAPLENRVWYQYAGAPQPKYVGPGGLLAKIGRVLDDGASQITRYEYNAKGNKTREIDPLGRETIYEYDANDIDLLRVKVKNGAGYDILSSTTYNAQHKPLTTTDAAGQTTTYTYNTAGDVLTVTTPPRAGITEPRTTTYTYDPVTKAVASVTGPGGVSGGSTAYDAVGRVRTTTDMDGYTLTFDYDAADRPKRTTYPDGTYEETQYDRLDPTRKRDRLGRWTHTFYDALRRAVATRDPAGRVVKQEWCNCGSLDKLIDANGNATTWERDLQGRVAKEIRANGSFKQTVYETTTSRVKKTIDAKNQEIQYTYALDGKLSSIQHVNAQISTPDVSFSYADPVTSRLDGHGRVRRMTDGTGLTNYTYLPFGQLGAGQIASVDGPLANDTISHTYDELGRVKTRTLNGVTTSWNYDVQGRLTTIGDPIGNFTYGYVGTTDRVSGVTYPNGQTTTYAYYPVNQELRLQEIHHKKPDATTLNRFEYTYDAVGNIKVWTQQTDTNPANAYDLEYDGADQLTAATYRTTAATSATLKRYRYAYDPAGNRTVEQIDDAATLATYDNMNRLTGQLPGGALLFRGSINEPATVVVGGQPATTTTAGQFTGAVPAPSGTSQVTVTATDPSGNTRTNTYQVNQTGAAKSFTYDANGNMTGDGSRTYEWDAENRLVTVKQGATTLASFVYDGNGKRAEKRAAGVTTSFLYGGNQVVEERFSVGATKRYVYGLGIDRPLAQSTGGTTGYFVADHLGSIVRVTESSGAPTFVREYDLWGNLQQGSTLGGPAFTGREWDNETGLHYYRARYYDQAVGRFLSQDPMGAKYAGSRYAYVAGNPTLFTDPTGLVRVNINRKYTNGGFLGGRSAIVITDVSPDCLSCRDDTVCTLQFVVNLDIFVIYGWPCSRFVLDHEERHIATQLGLLEQAMAPLREAESRKYKSAGECYAAAFKARNEFASRWIKMRGTHQNWIDYAMIPCVFQF